MKKTRRQIINLLLVFALFLQIIMVPMPVEATSITAGSAIVIDHDTGEVLYQKNPDANMVPASITKVMTAYIIYEEIEAGNLTKDSMIKVSKEAARMSRDGTYPMAIALEEGKSYSVDKFLELIMVPSASASCYAVAEHISGSEKKFVERMNNTAKKMGLTANFKNSHGARAHSTTARSLATLISNFIDEYPDILHYTSLDSIQFRGKKYNMLNRFINVDKYQGADGFKTGTIAESGYCLASTAERNGRRIISIVLNSSSNDNRYKDSRKILDIGFSQQAKLDKSREETKMEFKGLPETIRLNSDYKIDVNLSKISNIYTSKVGWLIDDKPYKTVENARIKNGIMSLNIHALDMKDDVKIGFYLEDFKGDRQEIVTNIKISDKAPALYRDIDGSKVEEIVEDLSSKGILFGVKNGYFGTESKVRRGDFMTGLGRVIEYLDIEEINNEASSFEDVKDSDYYNKYIAWGERNNIIVGHNNMFNPKDNISKAEVAVIMDRLLANYDIEGLELDIIIKDNLEIPSWANESVEKVLELGLMELSKDGNFNADELVNRADFASIIFKAMSVLENNN